MEAHIAVQKQGPVCMEQLQVSGGIASSDVKKHEHVGLCAIESVAFSLRKDLLQNKGISEASVDKSISIDAATKLVPFGFISASKLLAKKLETSKPVPVGFITASLLLSKRIKTSRLVPLGFVTAAQLFAQRLEDIQVTYESTEFDKILEGGIESGSVSEIYSEIRSGKSQLLHPLCSTCQLPLDQGGGGGKAMYIDAEGAFRTKRLLQEVERSGLHNADSIGLDVFPCQNIKGTSSSVSPTSAMETIFAHLPSVNWSEILLKAALPVKTLVNLSAHKFWNSIITDPWFVKEFDRRGEPTNILLVQEADRLHFTLYNLETHTWNKRITFPDGVFERNQFDIVGSCRGLLLMTTLHDINAKIVVWNPSIRKVREVPPQGQNQQEKKITSVGYGFGLKTDSYDFQIIRICCMSPPEVGDVFFKVQVFSLASNSWGTLDPLIGLDQHITFRNHVGVYFEGNIYWGLRGNSERDVLCYNMTSACFKILPAVPEIQHAIGQWVAGVCSGSLGLLVRKQFFWGIVDCNVFKFTRHMDTEEEIWEWYETLANVSRPTLAMGRPLSHTRHGYNTAIYRTKTADFKFAVDTEVSNIVVLPGGDLEFYVDQYTESLQFLETGSREANEGKLEEKRCRGH